MSSKNAKTKIKPPALRRGDTVGIVAPASNIQRELLERGSDALRDLGYIPVYQDSILDRDLYFAGSPERRAHEMEEMFARGDVKAILCARGGYGANYLLPAIDAKRVVANPKILVGYSDLTTLLTRFLDSAGLITFHGPMVAKDFPNPDGIDLASWEAALSGSTSWSIDTSPGSGVRGLREGRAEGILYGGCLSMLVASLGTPYEIQTDGTILFIEDVATKPFQIDRMLMQMKFAGKFAGVKGVVFGEMLDCRQGPVQDYTLEDVVERVVGNLGVPVAYGLHSGHVTRQNVTLPLGVRCSLEVSGAEVQFKILESAVT